MTTFEYISVQDISTSADDFLATIKQYGLTGWKFVLVYNGFIFFERQIRTEVN